MIACESRAARCTDAARLSPLKAGGGRAIMLVAMVALLGSVAYFYQRMGNQRSGRHSGGGGAAAAAAESLTPAQGQRGGGGAAAESLTPAQRQTLQAQVEELKKMMKKIVRENAELKKSASELRLRKEELRVCNANLQRVRKDKGKVESWAIKVDDDKEAKAAKLKEARGKLKMERVKSSELSQQVDTMQAKLTRTKSALKEIEAQKEQSVAQFQEQKTKYSTLREELASLQKKGQNKQRQAEIGVLIGELNQDLRRKSNMIQELTKQKRSSDDMLRRLEGKLMEAGVKPADIAKAAAPKAVTTNAPPDINPAAAGMVQVGAGTGAGATGQGSEVARADILFARVDDNKDHSIDLEEFRRHLKPEIATKAAGRPGRVKLKFDELDRDLTGFVSKEEALSKPGALLALVVADLPATNKTAEGKGGGTMASSLSAAAASFMPPSVRNSTATAAQMVSNAASGLLSGFFSSKPDSGETPPKVRQGGDGAALRDGEKAAGAVRSSSGAGARSGGLVQRARAATSGREEVGPAGPGKASRAGGRARKAEEEPEGKGQSSGVGENARGANDKSSSFSANEESSSVGAKERARSAGGSARSADAKDASN